jgi:hypothetical protein
VAIRSNTEQSYLQMLSNIVQWCRLRRQHWRTYEELDVVLSNYFSDHFLMDTACNAPLEADGARAPRGLEGLGRVEAPRPRQDSPAPSSSRVAPELLAPAGDWECIQAAIENGADAVYFGLDSGFNARARAKNFSPDDLPEVMRQLHRRGVKGYVTFNTLVFPNELPHAARAIERIAAGGVDAVLAASIFHFGTHTIAEARSALSAAGITVREMPR